MNVKQRKRLRDRINTLSSTEHFEIFKMINSCCDEKVYTKNTNGVFFDLKNLNNDIIQDIDHFVTFCIENQEVLDEYDKRYNECKTQNTFEKVIKSEHSTQQHNLVNIGDNNDNLEEIIKEMKINKKTEQFVNIIQTHTEKLFKKNTSTKFTNAKKKYAKRVLQDKKIESEQQSNLCKENYFIV